MRTEFIYSLAALSAIPVVANADAEAYKASAVQTVGTESDVELKVGTLAKGKYTLTSDAISGANLTVKVMAGETLKATGEIVNGKEISLNFVAENQLTDVKIVLVHTTKTVTVPAPVITLKFDFAGIAKLLQIEHNKLTQALAGYEYEKSEENTAAVGYYDRIMAIAAADYAFYKANTEGLQSLSLYADQSNVNGLALYGAIQQTFTDAKDKEKTYQEKTLGGGNGLLGQYDATYQDLETQYGVNYVTDALTDAKNAAKTAYDTYIADVTNFDNRTAAKNAIAAYKTALDAVVTVKNDNEGAKTELNEALNAVYGATNNYYEQTQKAIETNYDGKRYEELRGDLKTALAAIVGGKDYKAVQAAINKAYTNKTAKADKNTLINQIAAFKQLITQKTSDFNALKDQLATAYATYDEQEKSAGELVAADITDLAEKKQAVLKAVTDLETFITENDRETTIGNLTQDAIATLVNTISAKKVEYSDQKAKYDKYIAVKASVDAKATALTTAVTAADAYAKDEKGLPESYKPSYNWAATINAITTQINGLLDNVETNKWNAANYEKSEAFTTAMAAITTATDDFVSRAKEATDLYATIAGQVATAGTEKDATLNIKGIQSLNVWTNQVTTDEAIKARTPYNTVINTTIAGDAGHINDWTNVLKAAVKKTEPYNPDPNADNTGNILGYLQDVLKSLGGDASKVLADDIATLKAIQENWESDEQAFSDQIDQQQIAGMKTMINTKAEQFEPMIAALQTRIDDGEFGKIKGGLLKTEIDAISQKINDAKAVAAKQDATKTEVTAAYNAIKNLKTTDIATAQTNANTYKKAFAEFTKNYNKLNGSEDDSQDAGTVYGLKAKVKAQKDAIDGMANLSADQKTALKAKVDAVQVVKEEGDPAVEVTYTIATIDEFIKEAWQNEELTDAEVTKYNGINGIISGLKAATDVVAVQAGRLNVLEGNLATINFNAAKTAILAKDPNTEGFFVVDKLLGNEKAGQCTFDFNALKSTIEADEDITSGDLYTYNNQIDDLKDVINGLPAAAEANLKDKNAALKAYSDDEPEAIAAKGAVQRYEYYVATLKAERQTTALEGQLATLATLKEALDQLKADAEAHYAAGTASATDKNNIDNKAIEIKGKFDEYYNEVNYNAQVAADNLAQYNLIKDAKATVQGTYDVAASVINTYKNFKSDELKGAAESAQTELQNLLDYLVGYDALVSGDKGIQTRAYAAYNAVVSPEKFDGTSYIAEYQAVNEQITNLKKALTDKIEPLFKDAVSKSVNSYSEAITLSKAKVAKFSAGNDDLSAATVDGLFANIDNLLKAITDVKDDADKLADLDAALAAAANATNGIKASITTVEQTQAQKALKDIILLNTNRNLLPNSDKNTISNIEKKAKSSSDLHKNQCVDNFASYKSQLNSLKTKADQIAADNATINATKVAITTATKAANSLNNRYMTYAAGSQVKADVEQIMANVEAISGTVTINNAAGWKTAAEAISADVTTVYGKLYDAEFAIIEGLISKAKEENLTWSGDKAAMTTSITTEETNLANVKTAVGKKPNETGSKTKQEALADLKNIETALNGYIKTLTDDNQTSFNAQILATLNAEISTQQTKLNNSLNELNGYTIPTALKTATANIQTAIDKLNTYVNTDHANDISAYQTNANEMLQDIKDAIDQLYTDVQAEKDKQDADAAAAALTNLNNTWNTVQGYINNAETNVSTMEAQLGYYGSASVYANKVSKLNEQIAEAQAILDAAKDEADGKTTTAQKQTVADEAKTDVNTALTNVDENSTDITNLAKQAYIDAFIDNLRSQVIAKTWTNSSNYTATDKGILDGKWNAIRNYVGYVVNDVETKGTLKTNAEGYSQAEIIYHPTDGYETSAGVLATLERGETTFNDMLSELKQLLKDMSLAEDVKGHIVPGKDEIDTDDMEALADIILNGEEATADLARCDVNGDGDVDVTDLVWLRYFLVHGEWPNAQAAAAPALYTFGNGGINNVTMEATANGNITRVAVNLTNETEFKHFQLNLQLPMGAKVVGQRLGERVEGANLLIAQNDNEVRMLAVSTANNVFAGNEGAVVYLDIENLTGDVTIEKVIFVDTALNGHRLNAGETTGIADRISNAIENAGQKIYDLGGRLMNSVKKGINIIRNADGSTKKVINK